MISSRLRVVLNSIRLSVVKVGPALAYRFVKRIRRSPVLLAGTGLMLVTFAVGDVPFDRSKAPVERGGIASHQQTVNPPDRAASTQPLPDPSGAKTVVHVVRGQPFIWPADGPLTSEMGPWHPLGIDISLEVDEESPVRASAVGTVTLAGGEVWEDLGYHVAIDHGGGLETIYGHLDQILVAEGDLVNQGDVIGPGRQHGQVGR